MFCVRIARSFVAGDAAMIGPHGCVLCDIEDVRVEPCIHVRGNAMPNPFKPITVPVETDPAKMASGLLPSGELGLIHQEARRGAEQQASFSADDFRAAASEMRFAAEIAMQRDHIGGDDPMIVRFARYADMLEQAATRA